MRDMLDRLGRGQDFRIARLRDAPSLAVARLLDREFPAPRSDLLAALEGRAAVNYDPDLSVVAFAGSRGTPEVVGAAVGHIVGDVSVGDLWAVDPAWRYSGVGVRMMAEAARLAIDAGLVRFQFFCDETVKETLSLARRAQAGLRFVERYWELRLTA
jgi:GNAT superfamily N-acetyltransferase